MRWAPFALVLTVLWLGAIPTSFAQRSQLPWFLDGPATTKVTDRALRVRDGNVYLSPDGPPVQRPRDRNALPLTLPLELAVIDAGVRPRVLVVDSVLRVALYVDPASLAEVTQPGATILAAPGRVDLTPRSPGVRLASGLRVERVSAPAGGFVKVTYDDGVWHAQGSMDIEKLARVFRPAPLPRERFKPDAVLRGVPEILAEPNGKIAVAVPHDASYPVERLGPPSGGWTLVRAREQLLEVVGWVPADVVLADPKARMPREPEMLAAGSVRLGHDAKRVAAATPLYDRPGGEVVGVTMSDQGVSLDEERPDGWWRSDFQTPVGDIPLWLAP